MKASMRTSAGWLTVLLHLLAGLLLWQQRLTRPVSTPSPALSVYLVAAAQPRAAATPLSSSPPRVAAASPAKAAQTSPPQSGVAPAQQIAAAPATPLPATAAPGDPLHERDRQVLDIDAMKRLARSVQTEDRLTAQLRQHPISPHKSEWDKTADKMAQAARPDCLTAFQHLGVLAAVAIPLAIVVDKKDSGCKF